MPVAWKAWESRVARLFGGRRRGAQTSREGRGLSDVIEAKGWAIECALLARPTFSQLLEKARQAERAAKPDEMPIAIIKKKHQLDRDALVVMRLSTFCDWHVGDGWRESEHQAPETR